MAVERELERREKAKPRKPLFHACRQEKPRREAGAKGRSGLSRGWTD
jgi:hypothetical protein